MGSVEMWERWQEVLETARKDIVLLFHNRSVWRVLLKMLNEKEDIPHHQLFNDWLSRLYVTTQAVGIRRQRDRGRDPATLGYLLHQMSQNPKVVTKDRFFGGQTSFDDSLWATYSDPSRKHIDPRIPASDLAKLNGTCENVRIYVDKYLAHRDRKAAATSSALAYDDLNASLDVLGGLLRRYTLVMRQTHLAYIAPVSGWGWLNMFSVPWLPDDFLPPSDEDLLDAPLLEDP